MLHDSEALLLDTIYAAALQPSLWNDVLNGLGALEGGDSMAMSRLDVVTGEGASIAINNGKRPSAEYFSHYYAINPLQIVDDPSGYVADWTPKILLDEDCVDREVLEQSEYYNDYLLPLDAAWKIFIRLGLAGREVTAIGLGRSHRRGRFEREDMAKIERSHEHLIRAYRLSERFAAVHHRANGLAAAVDKARSAMILVNAAGVPLHVNQAAELMLSTGMALCLREGRLSACDPASARAMEAAVSLAVSCDRRTRAAGSFMVRAAGRRLPFTGTVMPLIEERTSIFGSGAVALVSLEDPVVEAATNGERIAATFGLTAAEARLSVGLLEGLDLHGFAARQGVSFNTVRSQLASIFTKTGVRRQAELVGLLMRVA